MARSPQWPQRRILAGQYKIRDSTFRMNSEPYVEAGAAMINVSGWRHEPGQIISDVTARLLKWMEHANLGSTMTVDEVADEVRIGLCELMEAQSCIVLARLALEDQLTLMSAADPGFQSLLHDFEPPRFASRGLLAVLPAEPFFMSDAPPPVQVLIGELWDSIRDTASLARSNTPESEAENQEATMSRARSVL
jgi:hypothetical protein